MKKTDIHERDIYSIICSHDGIKAKDIAKELRLDRKTVNVYLYSSAFMRELCYQDRDFSWHGLIRQRIPHTGLGDFCAYYSGFGEFIRTDEEEWMEMMKDGCRRIGRNLNDNRGLFHSFLDSRNVMTGLYKDLREISTQRCEDWEIAFELRINRSRMIRIYADVLLITKDYVFSLEFKMKDTPEDAEIAQAAKYSSYMEVLFGERYEIIPVLVLTKTSDLYKYVELEGSSAQIPICSGDMLFNIIDEYIGLF